MKNTPHKDILEDNLAKIAVFFFQTHGIPRELFNEMMAERFTNQAEQWLFCLNFGKQNPQIGIINPVKQ